MPWGQHFTRPRRRLKTVLRRTANRCGIEISRDPYLSRVVRLARAYGIMTVIDIGANEGQFAKDLRALGYRQRIVSVEPLSQPFTRLATAARRDPQWSTIRAAISDSPGELTVHIAKNSVSSSPLRMLKSHAEADPNSSYIAQEVAPAMTLDGLIRDQSIDPRKALLKIDVQGFESAVLDGAAESLADFAAVQLELTLVPLYEGQALMTDLVDRMCGLGFRLWILIPEFSHPTTGRTLQCDGLFVRGDLADGQVGAR